MGGEGKQTSSASSSLSERSLYSSRFTAVVQGIDMLIKSVVDSDLTPTEAGKGKAIDVEVIDLLSLLGREGETAKKLWSSTGEIESNLDIVPRLASLRRAVAARMAIFTASVDPATETASLPTSAVDEDSEETAFKLPTHIESLMISHIVEKFYTHWAFRGIIIVIIAALGLATGGALYLGVTDLDLNSRMEAAYKTSQQALDKKRDTVQESLSSQIKSIDDAKKNLDDSKTNFSKTVATDTAAIEQLHHNFTETLKTETVDSVVGMLRNEIGQKSSDFAKRIDAQAQSINNIDKLLQKNETPDLESRAKAISQAIAFLGPQIDGLRKLLDNANAEVNNISAAKKSAEDAKNLAEKASAAAKSAQNAAESYRDQAKAAAGSHVTPPPIPAPSVTAIQDKLNKLCYRQGQTDNVIGHVTVSAIIQFQKSLNATPDGHLSESQTNILLKTPDKPGCPTPPPKNNSPRHNPAGRPAQSRGNTPR